MSLNWNLSKIENHEEKCWDGDDMNPVTHALIFATLPVGLGGITNKNWAEFYLRIHIYEGVKGSMLKQRNPDTGETSPRPFTEQDIKDHIGLHVNVKPETRAQFLKRMAQGLEHDLNWKRRQAEKEDAA